MNEYLKLLLNSIGAIPSEEQIREDSFTAVLAKELDHVKAKTYDIVYPEMKARQLIPVDHSVPSGANRVVYKQWDGVGIANIIANYADDIALVDALCEEFTVRVFGIALGYQYSIQDIRATAMSGNKLDQRRSRMTRRGVEQKIDDMGWLGDAAVGVTGLANNANIPIVAPITGAWAAATGLQIVQDMLECERAIVAVNRGTFKPTTMAIANTLYQRAATTLTSVTGDGTKTALKFFLETSAYVKEVVPVDALELANAALTGPRLICYTKNPDVMELTIPQEFEQFPPQAKNLSFTVPCHARCAGVLVHYPIGACYMDGL